MENYIYKSMETEKNESLQRYEDSLYNLNLLRDRISALVHLAIALSETTQKKEYKRLIFRANEIFTSLPPYGFENYNHLIINKGYRLSSQKSTFGESMKHMRFDDFFRGKYLSLIKNGQFNEAHKIALDTVKKVILAIDEILFSPNS